MPRVLATQAGRDPDGRKATGVTGGTYDPVTETVTIARFGGKADVKLVF